MARNRKPDTKEAALAQTRTLDPRPEAVRDDQFASSEFFDARDLVQVKYEMVRRVRVTAPRSRRPRPRSGSPGRRTTRPPPRWTATGWARGAGQARPAARAQAHRRGHRLRPAVARSRPRHRVGATG